MLRLPKRAGRLASAFLLCAFTAWALSLPMLQGLGVFEEKAVAGLYALAASALISLYGLISRRLRFLAPLLLASALALAAALLPASLPARATAFWRALASGAPVKTAFLIYLDALLPLVILLIALFARMLMEGEPAFALPLLSAPLVMMWFAGAREGISAYFPAVLCLPLMYLYTNSPPGEEPLARAPRSLAFGALAIALALALLASSLTPAYRKTQPQLERMADTIRRRVEDLFFFTATRTMFSLSSQGYQPMGEKSLGGRPDISTRPVMNVQSSERVYLRGTALDTYTGHRWYDSLSSQRHGWNSLRYAALRAELFNEDLPGDQRVEGRKASVTMLGDMPSTLFVPQRLRQLDLGPDMVAYFNASSEVFITRDLANGDHYSFLYEPYVAGEARTDALAARLLANGAPLLPELPAEYTALPAHLKSDGIVANLARDIAGGLSDPYSQALALQRYLKSHYAYSIEVPPAPEKIDFAVHFLFDVQRGYCTYFATAMTVLARSLNLPARYVEGFLAQPEGAPGVTLTGMNAHAWTEVYIAGLGWVVFDATAPRAGEDPDSGDQPPPPQPPSPSPSPTPSPSPEPDEQPSPQPQDAPTPTPPPSGQPSPAPTPRADDAPERREPPRPFPWWLLLLLALMSLFLIRARAAQPARRERALTRPEDILTLYWQAILEARRALGQAMSPQETPLGYAGRLAGEAPGLEAVAAAYSAWVFGKVSPEQALVQEARAQYAQAWRKLSPWRRALLWLGRGLRSLTQPFYEKCKLPQP